jgi:ATP-dependent Clp protease protease subunit
MPIGVPRIIYCWGEELPAQWTDIYNFIFRRRMVFLMQYLDDELCNQICGLLINIHMEDQSKELEAKEINTPNISNLKSNQELETKEINTPNISNLKSKSVEDFWNSTLEHDLAIDENFALEQDTLQAMTREWLNWNTQFFDYSDEPNLFYLAEILSTEPKMVDPNYYSLEGYEVSGNSAFNRGSQFEIYSPFRFFSDLRDSQSSPNYPSVESPLTKVHASVRGKGIVKVQQKTFSLYGYNDKAWEPPAYPLGPSRETTRSKSTIPKAVGEKNRLLLSSLAKTELWDKIGQVKNQIKTSDKALSQRKLRKDYSNSEVLQSKIAAPSAKSIVQQLLTMDSPTVSGDSTPGNIISRTECNKTSVAGLGLRREFSRKQTEQAFQDFESKKVFMIINSFGGSVGNGITVHDALQFIKAGSVTIALGVAASAASLALAGGSIGERYVTEGCHTMIHQPESSLSGQASDIWIDSLEIMKMRQEVANIYSLSTYRPRHKILRDLDRDFYLTATETIYYGLADELASHEVISEIIETTQQVWDYHNTKQQRLLESRDNLTKANTQTQN